MVFPSARVCVVSVTATALYGAPVTTLPGCISPKPKISTFAPTGPPGPPMTVTIPSSAPGGGGTTRGSCAVNTLAPSRKTPPETKPIHFVFILASPLLSRYQFLCRKSVARGLWQTQCLRLTICRNQQIHLNPIRRAFFAYGQAEGAKSPALQLHAHYRGVVQKARHAAG